MTLAPLHWTKAEWRRLAEGAGTVAVLMMADKRSRASCTHRVDAVSRFATPWGGSAPSTSPS